MGKRPVWFWFFTAGVIVAGLLIEIGPLHERVGEWVGAFWHFVKENTMALLAAFFLVKGKFVLKLFVKKVLLVSVTGLGKRYLVERVFTYHFKIYFLDHLKGDFARLFTYIKENFMRFPPIKKLVAALAFLGSLGYVGKFMGMMLAVKVLIAKVWSFLLAAVLKAGSAVVYFFTDYLWGSWLAPIVEVVVFSWFLELLERVPLLTKSIRRLFVGVLWLFQWFERVLGHLLHHPVKNFFRWAVGLTRRMIYTFIGYRRLPAYRQLRALRAFEPNAWKRLRQRREARKKMRLERLSFYWRHRRKERLQ